MKPFRHSLLVFLTVLGLGLSLGGAAFAAVRVTMIEGTARTLNLTVAAADVMVANADIADVYAASPKSIFVSAVRPGSTTVVAVDAKDNTIATYEIVVVANNSKAAAALPDGLAINQADNVAAITGATSEIGDAYATDVARGLLDEQGRTVIDRSTYLGPSQVTLRVRFVEASRTALNSMGIDLAALSTSGPDALRVVTGLGSATDFIEGEAVSGPAIGLRRVRGGATIDGLLQALETRGLVEILSEPTLTTVSGRRANFRAGGEIAYPVNQGDGVIAAAFKEYGVSVDFLPTILPGNRIALEVSPEVSFVEPGNAVRTSGFAAPGVSVRRAQTTVELGSGQTFAIAGLYEQYASDSRKGVPGLSGIFGNQTRQRNERELMIFITAYLTDAADVATPRTARPNPRKAVGFITK